MAGGNKAVAEKTGISLTTTQNYLKGGEMKLSNALAIAGAAGVSLEWLATGQGPMRPGQAAPPAEPASTAPFRLFGNVDLDRLRRAIEGATASAGGDDRLLLHLIVVLYDQLSELEEPAP